MKLGAKVGRQVIISDEIAGNGRHDPDGTIYINPKTENAARVVLVHEFTHDIETSKVYERFSKAVLAIAERIDGANLNQMKEQIWLEEPGLDDPGVERELVARIAGSRLFTYQNMVNRLFKIDQTLFTKIKNWLSDMKVKFLGTDYEKMIRDAEKLYIRAMETRGEAEGYGKGQFSIQNIVSDSGKNYGIGVYLDSDLLTGLSDADRKEMVKELVKTELAGKELNAYDKNGNPVTFIVAENKKFKTEKGKKVPANKDLATKYSNNKIKQEAIVLIDELAMTATNPHEEDAKHKHDWIDDNGKNKWDEWEVYLQDKNNAVYMTKLKIANSIDGKKRLYDIDTPKKIEEGRGKSRTTTSTRNSIFNSVEKVNTKISQDSKGGSYSDFLEEQRNRRDAPRNSVEFAADQNREKENAERVRRAIEEDDPRNSWDEEFAPEIGEETEEEFRERMEKGEVQSPDLLSNGKQKTYWDMLAAQREKLQKNGAKTGVTMTVDDWVGMAKNLVETSIGTLEWKDPARALYKVAGRNRRIRNELYELIEKPIHESQGKYASNLKEKAKSMTDKFSELGIKAKSKESKAVQWIGEGQREIGKTGETEEYTLTDLQHDFPEKWQDIKAAADYCREVYDQYLKDLNDMYSEIYPATKEAAEDQVENHREAEKALRKIRRTARFAKQSRPSFLWRLIISCCCFRKTQSFF